MSMTKPTSLLKNAYDSTTASMFYFTTRGGNQVVKNRITIRLNSTNAVVYQNTVTSFLFQQEVPANTLVNGTYYNYYFNTYDVDDNISPDGNSVAFYCYSSPTITLTNKPSTNIVDSSSYTFDATYDQAQDELLNYLVYALYDSTGVEISNSGNLYNSNTPPVTFQYMFSGFENNTTYKIQIKAISVNNTITYSEMYTFSTIYYNPSLFSLLTLENDCEDGKVDIRSSVVLAEGEVSPNEDYIYRSKITDGDESTYIQWDTWYTPTDDIISLWTNSYAIELVGSKVLTFNDGFSIPTDFQYQRWMYPIADGVVEYLYKTGNESNRMVVELKSGIPSGESTVKNWFELYTEDNTLHTYSNYVDAMKVDTNFIIWFKKVGNTYTTLLDVVSIGTGSTISWLGTGIYPSAHILGNIDSLFPLDTLELRNGVYDQIDITADTSRIYSQSFPIWDYNTKLNCDCSSLNAGNIDVALSQLESIRIKRRLLGTFDWITIRTVPITSAEDLNIITGDCGVPTDETFDYAIVLILSGGVEGDYIIQSITTNFRWCYLCDGDTIIKFYSNINRNITSNPTGGMLVPIGRRTPITIYNSENDYESGTFSGNVLGANFLATRQINRKEVQQDLARYKTFINNHRPKFLKDWDGRCQIVDVNIGSGLNETPDLISGKAMLNLSYVEKGAYNNKQELYDNGLIDSLD